MKLIEAIRTGDNDMIKFYLRTKGKCRGYVEKAEYEHTGKDGGPIEIKNKFPDWTKEELLKYAATGEKPDRK